MQFVFIDTPGMHKPKNSLGDFMVKAADSSMKDADAVILVADAGRNISETEKNVISYIKESGAGSILALNKVDLYRREQIAETIAVYADEHDFDAVVPISAKKGENVNIVLKECEKFLCESDWFFPDDIVTDQPERQIAAEIIREKLLRALDREIPHGTAVVIEDFKDEDTLISIRAEIFCEKESHKRIIIGKNGAVLKMVGSYARSDLEKMFGAKVYLNLWVKVKENWRESIQAVNNFGYREE